MHKGPRLKITRSASDKAYFTLALNPIGLISVCECVFRGGAWACYHASRRATLPRWSDYTAAAFFLRRGCSIQRTLRTHKQFDVCSIKHTLPISIGGKIKRLYIKRFLSKVKLSIDVFHYI